MKWLGLLLGLGLSLLVACSQGDELSVFELFELSDRAEEVMAKKAGIDTWNVRCFVTPATTIAIEDTYSFTCFLQLYIRSGDYRWVPDHQWLRKDGSDPFE